MLVHLSFYWATFLLSSHKASNHRTGLRTSRVKGHSAERKRDRKREGKEIDRERERERERGGGESETNGKQTRGKAEERERETRQKKDFNVAEANLSKLKTHRKGLSL